MPDPSDLSDLFPEQTSDDIDESGGDELLASDDAERILAEKPPHHVD